MKSDIGLRMTTSKTTIHVEIDKCAICGQTWDEHVKRHRKLYGVEPRGCGFPQTPYNVLGYTRVCNMCLSKDNHYTRNLIIGNLIQIAKLRRMLKKRGKP